MPRTDRSKILKLVIVTPLDVVNRGGQRGAADTVLADRGAAVRVAQQHS